MTEASVGHGSIEPLRSSQSLPLRLSEDLRQRLQRGEWTPGERLPSEPSLASMYKVSRPTVRLALRRLEEAGLVRVRHGAGAFVTSLAGNIRTGLQDLRSTTKLIADQGHQPGVEYRLIRRREASLEERTKLELPARDTQVVAYERALSADGTVVAFEYGALAAHLLPDDWDSDELEDSVFATLEVHGLLPDAALAEVRPVRDKRIGWGDQLPKDGLYLCLDQVQTLSDEARISWSLTYFAAESPFQFFILRTR